MLDKNYSEQSCGCKTTNRYYKSPYGKPSIRREGCWQGGYTEDKDRLQELLGGTVIPIRGGAHNRFKSYEDFTIVYDEDTLVAYVSKQPVPKGVEITNRDYWQPMNVSGYCNESVIIISDKDESGQLISYTLPTVLPTIADVARRKGAIITFYSEEDGVPHWEMWQFWGTDVSEWEDASKWRNIYDYISNEFGSSTTVSISQKTMTEAINKLWEKIEKLTGETMRGINMTVTPTSFTSEEGCVVHITAQTDGIVNVFEHLSIYANGRLLTEATNTDSFEFDTEISETTTIKCIAKILGLEYTKEKTIIGYNYFWLGGSDSYENIKQDEYIIPIIQGMQGTYPVACNQGDRIYIIIPDSLGDIFSSASINNTEIIFTQSSVVINDIIYKVFTSATTYNAGTYNVKINS